MCRAVHALVVASESEAPRLRRAAGLEVQVVGIVPSADVGVDGVDPDVLIVHAAAGATAPAPGPAVVWVGADAPAWAHHALPDDENLGDALAGAIVKALIARRRDGGAAS